MRAAAETRGPICYLINTENHVDHIFGNYWFRGAGEVVNHKALWDIFMDPKAALDPFDYALEAIPTDDPEGAPSSRIATSTTRTCRAGPWCSPETY